MKEVKQWMKDHKKEIIICVVAAGGTALYFLKKEKKIKGVKAGLRLSLEFLDDEENGDRDGFRTSLSLHKPGYTVGDLGKFGVELMECIPSLTKDVPIDYSNTVFNVIKK